MVKTTDRLEAIGFSFILFENLFKPRQLSSTTSKQCFELSAQQCFEQPAASCLVCSLIFIEFHSTVTYGQMLILLFFYAISNFNWPALTPILSVLPATKSPLRRSSANLSSTSVCRVLRSGRAPISGSYP
ncbi:S1 RNA-binding domain-containing protein [Streptococcus pneumoniae]|nr:S1 RNA-binding domain-containing protein [Streptococcus pneumoniae]